MISMLAGLPHAAAAGGCAGGQAEAHQAIEERNARLTEQAHALLEAASHLHDRIAGASK